jgi:hypothetical protein
MILICFREVLCPMDVSKVLKYTQLRFLAACSWSFDGLERGYWFA